MGGGMCGGWVVGCDGRGGMFEHPLPKVWLLASTQPNHFEPRPHHALDLASTGPAFLAITFGKRTMMGLFGWS